MTGPNRDRAALGLGIILVVAPILLLLAALLLALLYVVAGATGIVLGIVVLFALVRFVWRR